MQVDNKAAFYKSIVAIVIIKACQSLSSFKNMQCTECLSKVHDKSGVKYILINELAS